MIALKYGSQIGEDTRKSKPFPERGEVVETWIIEVKFCPGFAWLLIYEFIFCASTLTQPELTPCAVYRLVVFRLKDLLESSSLSCGLQISCSKACKPISLWLRRVLDWTKPQIINVFLAKNLCLTLCHEFLYANIHYWPEKFETIANINVYIYIYICKYTYDSLIRNDEICITFICSKILLYTRHRRNHCKTFFKMFGTSKMSSVEVTERPIVWTIYLGIFNSKIYKGAHYITSIISRWVFEEFLTIGLLNGRMLLFIHVHSGCLCNSLRRATIYHMFLLCTKKKLAIWIVNVAAGGNDYIRSSN